MSEATKTIELTDEHKQRYPEWQERYSKIQLSTDGTDRDEVVRRLNDLYRREDLAVPERILFAPSPIAAAAAGCLGKTAIEALKKEADPRDVKRTMLDTLDKLSRHIPSYFNNMAEGFEDQVEPGHQPDPARLYESYSSLALRAADLSPELGDGRVDQALTGEFEASLRDFQSSFNGGNTWAYSHAHLTFYRDVMKAPLPLAEQFANYQYLNENSGPRMMYEEFVIVSERPVALKTRQVNGVYQMHNPGGASVAWADGLALYHLGNVQVAPWMLLRGDNLDPRLFPRFTNSAQRAAFCQIVGMERILHANESRVLDEEPGTPSDYKLLELRVGEERFRYLSMRNQSIEVVHVEGVPTSCETIQQALNFRNGFRDEEICDVNGVEWAQHGDCVVFPEGATLFKSRPSLIS